LPAALPSDTQQVYDFFVQNGYTPAQASGLVGNFIQESGLNPEISNTTSGAEGLAQWLGSRQQPGLITGNVGTDLENQLRYVLTELRGSESSSGAALAQATTPSQAASVVFSDYERAGDSSLGTREQYAQEVYQTFGSSTPQTTSILSPIGKVGSDIAGGVGDVLGGIGGTAANAAGNLGGSSIVGDLGNIGTGISDIGQALNPANWLKNGVELVGILGGVALVVLAMWRAAPDKTKQNVGQAAELAPLAAA